MSSEALQALLANPIPLLIVMLLASLGHALKQLRDSKDPVTGQAAMSLLTYIKYWPETALTVILNVLAFLMLVATDQLATTAPLGLKLAAVIGIGFGTNSLSDLLRPGSGRSSNL